MGYYNAKNYKKMNKKAELLSKFDKLTVLEKANLVQKINKPGTMKASEKDF